MTNNRCMDIIYRNWPEDLEIWIRVEKKLNASKTVGLTGPAENGSALEFDPEEMELIKKLLQYLVSEYEKRQAPFAYLADKFGPSVLMLAIKELVEKLT